MSFNIVTTVGVVSSVAVYYFYFSGRFTVSLTVLIAYAIFYSESNEKHKEGNAAHPITPVKKEKKACCCSGKKEGEKKKSGSGSCCSGKKNGSGGGGCCSTKKLIDVDQNEIPQEDDSMTIDFTTAFLEKKSKKVKKVPKIFSAAKPDSVAPASPKQKEIEPTEPAQDNFIRSALTISNETMLNSQIYVFYSSLQGSGERCAKIVHETLTAMPELAHQPKLLNLDELNDIDEYFVDVPCENALYAVSYTHLDVYKRQPLFLEVILTFNIPSIPSLNLEEKSFSNLAT